MTKVQIRRLRKLAAFLRTVKKDRFYIGEWSSEGSDKNKCGTTACAMGWAPTVFPRQLELDEYGIPRAKGDAAPGAATRVVHDFFGLSEKDEGNIVYALSGTPRKTAQRIESVCRREEKKAANA